MGSGAHGDAFSIKDRANVMRMRPFMLKEIMAPLPLARPKMRSELIRDKRSCAYRLKPFHVHECVRGRSAACSSSLRRARSPARSAACPLRNDAVDRIGHAIHGDFLDHLAAAKERRQFLQPFFFSIERADPGRPIELMAGDAIEIGIEVNHIDIEMNRTLRTIDQDGYAALMRDPDDLLHRRHRAEHIRHMVRAMILVFALNARSNVSSEKFPSSSTSTISGRRPCARGEMPGHDIGVVLHDRKDDLVALFDESLAK